MMILAEISSDWLSENVCRIMTKTLRFDGLISPISKGSLIPAEAQRSRTPQYCSSDVFFCGSAAVSLCLS